MNFRSHFIALGFGVLLAASARMPLALSAPFPAGGTEDVVFGLDNPTWPDWLKWFEAMTEARAKTLKEIEFNSEIYESPASLWSDQAYRQYKIFMYDRSFFREGRYRTKQLIQEIRERFGKVDSVLLWHAYPQIGFDSRTQFDFYRQMPGGIKGLKRDVIDVFHRAGIRVFLNFNPWAVTDGPLESAHRELAEVIGELDADGVMLDTMDDVPDSLRKAIDQKKSGVVLAPERRMPDSDLSFARQSWAQWYDLGEGNPPSLYREKWLEPRHIQLTIRRWDRSRADDIIFSFFNASGLLLWENIYGSWNPYTLEDRALAAATGVLLGAYSDILTRGRWLPLIPTGVSGLDANRWELTDPQQNILRSITLFRNRTDQPLSYSVPPHSDAQTKYFYFWGNTAGTAASKTIVVAPRSTQALVLDFPKTARLVLSQFVSASRRARMPVSVPKGEPIFEEVTPEPWSPKPLPRPSIVSRRELPARGMAEIPGGPFTMTIEHAKREEGCYPWGANRDAQWGWYYEDLVKHQFTNELKPFGMKLTTVTNAEYLEFVRKSGYRPRNPKRFLQQIPRDPNGNLSQRLSDEVGGLPVTYVSLADARAYAHWKGERLPTEAEWQWAAEGAGAGYRWPWGNDDALRTSERVNLSGQLMPARSNVAGASPQGLLNLTGNVWELTESEWTDGHTHYLMLRGGVFLTPAPSEWVIPRGPRPNQFHAKYLMMSDDLDRSEAIGFRTMVDSHE
ncbi:SUMF1/EgtB/PvdO family nonheme iron enzyme [Bdellovibrionota bacterium FG-1]